MLLCVLDPGLTGPMGYISPSVHTATVVAFEARFWSEFLGRRNEYISAA